LLESGERLRLLVRDPQRLTAEMRAAELVVGNLADPEAMRKAVADVDLIYHCAANVATWDCWENYYASNVAGVESLLSAIENQRPPLSRLVHLSTVDVYGFPLEPADEDSPADGEPFGYGRSKAQGEALLRRRCTDHSIPYSILRPANVIGPGSQFVERIGRELDGGLMITIDGGSANAGLLHIDNLLDAMQWVARSPQAVGRVFNARDTVDMSWAQFLDTLRRQIGGRGRILNLSWNAAESTARVLEFGHALLRIQGEPLLHRLLVRIFGRTCGHSSARLRSARGTADRVGAEEAISSCARWYVEKVRM
jgi:nucleoside-diphosphate-sugar epimerase